MSRWHMHITRLAVALGVVSIAGTASAQTSALRLDPNDPFGAPLAIDRGAAGLRQRLLELGTFASVLETTAHPDDEQPGLLTYLSRGTGARTALLALTRGEAGANATGDELFDALGLVRTQEMLEAARYYGLDDVYFTSAADYGFSKTLGEATRSWDTTAVLEDMVRIIRANRPVVVISRWYGGSRDGHGHHQLAGVLTPLAVAAAGDPSRYPEQITRDGLAPWRVTRVLRSNLPSSDRAEFAIDASGYDAWLGMTYEDFGMEGYLRHASQNGGRRALSSRTAPHRLQVIAGAPSPAARDLFAGIPTGLPSLFTLTGEKAPRLAVPALAAAAAQVERARRDFNADEPWRVVPALSQGLRAIRRARSVAGGAPQAAALLEIKVAQFERALLSALGVDVGARVEGASQSASVAPGDRFAVVVTVRQGAPVALHVLGARLIAADGSVVDATVAHDSATNRLWRRAFTVAVREDASPDHVPFRRNGLTQTRYDWVDGAPRYEAQPRARWQAQIAFEVNGDTIRAERTVRARAPDGSAGPRLSVLPPVSLRVTPTVRIVTESGRAMREVTVEVTSHASKPLVTQVALRPALPGANASASQEVTVGPGERRSLTFAAEMPAGIDSLRLSAVATVGARSWSESVTPIAHPNLEPTFLSSDASALIVRVPVAVAPARKVAYVMGVGDLVPDAIAQLDASVTMLSTEDINHGKFGGFDAVVIGTRAYATRPELANATGALTRYASTGGNVVVLYQTQEFRPETMAPFAASLPDDAEETTEQDAPVDLLAPDHPLLTTPNRITPSDFDGWIEQRGSKFLATWSSEYTPLVSTHDHEQAPQRGIWLSARVGTGRWTYCALALHRQLPYGVPGAYRILANLISSP